jgi:hypothetical protein
VTKIPFAIAIAAAALSIVPAEAADLGRFPPAARFYPPPPPLLRVYNWTGGIAPAAVELGKEALPASSR